MSRADRIAGMRAAHAAIDEKLIGRVGTNERNAMHPDRALRLEAEHRASAYRIARDDAWRAVEWAIAHEPEEEAVHHPKHYNAHPSGVECISVVQHLPFTLGTAIKHAWRLGLKTPDRATDIGKALVYLHYHAGWICETVDRPSAHRPQIHGGPDALETVLRVLDHERLPRVTMLGMILEVYTRHGSMDADAWEKAHAALEKRKDSL
jgi:hypothetical protein